MLSPRYPVRRRAVTGTAERNRLGPQSCFGHPTSMSPAADSVSECAELETVAARVLARKLQTLRTGESPLPRIGGPGEVAGRPLRPKNAGPRTGPAAAGRAYPHSRRSRILGATITRMAGLTTQRAALLARCETRPIRERSPAFEFARVCEGALSWRCFPEPITTPRCVRLDRGHGRPGLGQSNSSLSRCVISQVASRAVAPELSAGGFNSAMSNATMRPRRAIAASAARSWR